MNANRIHEVSGSVVHWKKTVAELTSQKVQLNNDIASARSQVYEFEKQLAELLKEAAK